MHLQDNGNYYSVRLDGTVLSNPVIADNRANQTYLLASNLAGGSHTITVLKRTEPFNGPIAIFKGFSVDGGALVVKPNAPKTGRRLEFWGDSITCGYGDLGKDYTCNYSPDTEDETLAYGPVTGRALNADVSVVAWSGKGVVRNYGDSNPTSPDPMPIYLPSNTGNNLNNKYNWSWVPNAVVINLGTNDYSTNPTPSYSVFSSGYINMTNLVRTNYGKAVQIFTVCGPLIGDPCCSYVKNITTTLNSQGDANVHYVDMQNILSFPADYGCDYHPAVSGQQKMANVLIPVLKSVLGW
jgi:lysophospholipase L1-like esterase